MLEHLSLEHEDEPPAISSRRRWIKRIGWALVAIATPIVLFAVVLNSQFGKRFIADQIASYAPASGIRFEVGQIEGDVFREAILRDVLVSDVKGVFLTIPRVELDWRPLSWITSGLDVRMLAAHDGELKRLPELSPGDPDAPILPGFDIRVDHFEIDDLTIMAGVATKQSETVNLLASADIRDGLVALKLDGKFGKIDKISALLHAEPDGDRFETDIDYRAPAGGVIAGLVGAETGYHARLKGDGTWNDWLGHGLVKRGDDRFAAFRLTNIGGQYRIIGEAYTAQVATGILQRGLGARTGILIEGGFENSRFDGEMKVIGEGLKLQGSGGIDLAENRFDNFSLSAANFDPQLLGNDIVLGEASLRASLDGAFRSALIGHEMKIAQISISEIKVMNLRQEGTARIEEGEFRLPLSASIGKIVTGNELADEQLVSGRIGGQLTFSNGSVRVEPLLAIFPKLRGRFSLLANLADGKLNIAGPASVERLTIENVGLVQADARVLFTLNDADPWSLAMDIDGTLGDLSSAAVRQIAGETIAISSSLKTTSGGSIVLRDIQARSDLLQLLGAGELIGPSFAFDAQGMHSRYGQFSLDGSIEDGSPNLVLDLRSPLPEAGLTDVKLALAPAGKGYRIAAEGSSILGPFVGALGLDPAREGRPTTLNVDSLKIWKTAVDGQIFLEDSGLRGNLELVGGGLNGDISFSSDQDTQEFTANIKSRNAVFGGQTAIELGQAEISINGRMSEGSSRIRGDLTGRGIRYGRLFLGRVAARANILDGSGKITVSLVGRRGGRFNLGIDGEIVPGRIAAAVRGSYAETPISMPRRAVLNQTDNGNWRLSPTQIDIGNGSTRISGEFGEAGRELELKLANVPLNLADLAMRDFGAAGAVSGIVEFRQTSADAPTGTVKIKIDGLTRSSLHLASPATDVFLVATLDSNEFEAKALVKDGDERIGWLDARISDMPNPGSLFDRMQSGNLQANLQYDGASERLWRLAAIDTFDISGPVKIQAKATATIADPRVSGSLSSSNLRIRSVLSGTDIKRVRVQGKFEGPRLNLSRFAGTVGENGTIEGSGFVDLADLGPGRGPKLDLRASAKRAPLVDAKGLRATITGPLRIVSSGLGGTIAGRVDIDSASWQLGTAAEDVSLPEIATNEINLPADIARPAQATAPWRYLVDARARNRIDVDGLGLDSEWRGNIILRGTTSDPRLGGEAQVIRGTYSFAETSFELTRGRITFDEDLPIDPRLDILAEANRAGIDVRVTVRGKALAPEIAFSSEPPLPEEEILSRLLFGGPVTEISAIDAVQLGAALTSLRSGGGLGPVNRLRSEIGLDRLRIVGADPVLGRDAGVMLGENIGRRFYVEFVTDGKGYSASELEFRITSWLSLLGSVSTLGRESIVIEASRDY